jgi:hypothetical protein
MKAKTIVVAGGGVTGCETAGELAYEYGQQKEIIFVGLFQPPELLPPRSILPSSSSTWTEENS